MQTDLFESSRWMVPLGRLLRCFRRSTDNMPRQAAAMPVIRPVFPLRTAASTTPRSVSAKPPRRVKRSPLRVIRIVEAGQASTLAGRILISGRMADVCAELDRMVEREALIRASA